MVLPNPDPERTVKCHGYVKCALPRDHPKPRKGDIPVASIAEGEDELGDRNVALPVVLILWADDAEEGRTDGAGDHHFNAHAAVRGRDLLQRLPVWNLKVVCRLQEIAFTRRRGDLHARQSAILQHGFQTKVVGSVVGIGVREPFVSVVQSVEIGISGCAIVTHFRIRVQAKQDFPGGRQSVVVGVHGGPAIK